MEAIASRLEAIATRVEAIASNCADVGEAGALRNERFDLLR